MTTATVNCKTVKLSINEKARLLEVCAMNENQNLFVKSGSKPHFGYEVEMMGLHAISCTCESRVRCPHMIAAENYRREQQISRVNSCCYCGRLCKRAYCNNCL